MATTTDPRTGLSYRTINLRRLMEHPDVRPDFPDQPDAAAEAPHYAEPGYPNRFRIAYRGRWGYFGCCYATTDDVDVPDCRWTVGPFKPYR